MKNKFLNQLFLISIGYLFSITGIHAQITSDAFGYYQDALRFSQTNFSGTARYQGLAGAQTALGGDPGAASGNPAGLGFMRKSELSFSPALGFANTTTEYTSSTKTSAKDSKGNFNVNHLGIVIASPTENFIDSKWRGGAFAITLSRINNFHNRFSYKGINRLSSKTDLYVDMTNGIRGDELENLDLVEYEYQRAAYFAFLANPFFLNQDGSTAADNVDYFTYARNENETLLGDVEQSETVTTKGAQYQWSVAYGGNFDDKLYFGASLGIASVNYEEIKEYGESIESDLSLLESFTEKSELEVRGTGINFATGLIFRPIDAFRVGVSVSTPTLYALREEFKNTFTSRIFNADNSVSANEESTLPGDFNYRLTTPWKFNVGAAIFIGKNGFISADAEYLIYDKMKVRNIDNTSLLEGDNQTIQNIYKPTWNYRAGGEFRASIFRFRGGFAFQGDPFDQIDDIDRKRIHITGGLGMRLPEWYLDLGVVYTAYDSAYLPYSLDAGSIYAGTEPVTATKNKFTNVVVTSGFFF